MIDEVGMQNLYKNMYKASKDCILIDKILFKQNNAKAISYG